MSQPEDDRLDSWKEIAAHLGRDVRTVRRWEGERGLPIHRVPGGGRRAVFAFRSEIETWLRNAEGKPYGDGALNHGAIIRNDEPTQGTDVMRSNEDANFEKSEATPSSAGDLHSLPAAKALPRPVSASFQPFANVRFLAFITILVVIGAVVIGLALRSHGHNSPPVSESGFVPPSARWDRGPEIVSVTPILPQPKQRIVIQGRGFGLHVPYARTDSPYLAIRNETAHWAAGRIVPQNWDEVMLDVESWTDTQIVVNGFSGSYGPNGWKLSFADELEIAIWNPQSGAGPALYHAMVVSTNARR